MENNLNTKLNKINENVHSMKTGLGLEETSSIETLTNKVLEVRRVKPMTFSFKNCQDEVIENLDLLDISAYSNLDHMFDGCSKVKNLNTLRKWDVSQVRDMGYAFHGCDGITDFSFLND
jgi:surface protein